MTALCIPPHGGDFHAPPPSRSASFFMTNIPETNGDRCHIQIGGVSWCQHHCLKPGDFYTKAIDLNIPIHCGHDSLDSAVTMRDYLVKNGIDAVVVPGRCEQWA